MLLEVERGFLTGDLLPLAAYLSADADYPLDDILRKKLIEAIRGSADWHPLKLKKRGRGPGNLITERRRAHRDRQVWEFVQRALRAGGSAKNKGAVKAAIGAAAKEFNIKDSTAKKAYLAVEKSRAGNEHKKDTKKQK